MTLGVAPTTTAPIPAPGNASPEVVATVWDLVSQPQGRRVHLSRAEIFERFRVPAVTTNKKLLAGWAPTSFRGDYRNLENVEASYAVGLDVDGDGTRLEGVVAALGGLSGFVYSSYRHTPEAHRLRAIVWTSRPILPSEYRRCWQFVARRLPWVGQAAKDPSRLWFVPGVAPGGEYRLVELPGDPLDVDRIPADAASPPVTFLPVPTVGDERLLERARRYLAQIDPAIQGQNGSLTTLRAAHVLTRNFQLDEETAHRLLVEKYNSRCLPPWSVKELKHKIHDAARSREPPNWLASSPGSGPARMGGSVDRVTVQRAKLRRRREDPTRPPIWRVTFDVISDDREVFKYRFVVPSDGYDSDAIRVRYRAALPDVDCMELRTEWDCDVTARFAGRVYEVERRGGDVRRVKLLCK